ncbi:unnamed protein product [Rhizophagus irregularis]|uniref:Uncharacterized protein n=1 Tax=Rhizophagus irregularis TaxID=588596 RepID=A0A915Z052_9GLOM|nr:unnamed protein product [Rhizophagus irregularis]CAB5356540.1 unnamed protein product [Rhizophagus irregularis]
MGECNNNEYEFFNQESIKNRWKQLVERSIEQRNSEKIWKVRNFKEIYRAEKREKKRDVVKVDNKKIKEERRNDRVTGPLLDTPPQRVFSELGGIIDVIKKYREGVEEDVERDIITSKKLQKDNVTIEEVVKIINDQRDEMKNVPKMKIPYERYTVLSPPLLGWETSKKNVEALKAVNERFTMIHAGKASHQKWRN